MSQLRLRRSGEDDGFTLVELLVVILIIGILAAIAIPVYLSQRSKASAASEKSDLRAVAGKVEIYYTDKQTYVGVPFGSGAGPGQTVSGYDQTVGPGEKVNLSTGNVVTLESVGPDGYCLSAANPRVKSPAAVYYDSTGGGITDMSCASKSYS